MKTMIPATTKWNCDGCGFVAENRYLIPIGWDTINGRDFCGACLVRAVAMLTATPAADTPPTAEPDMADGFPREFRFNLDYPPELAHWRVDGESIFYVHISGMERLTRASRSDMVASIREGVRYLCGPDGKRLKSSEVSTREF